MYVLTDEANTQRDTLLLLQRDSLVPCVRFSDIYCDVIIMFRIVHSNKDLYLKIGNEKIMQ